MGTLRAGASDRRRAFFGRRVLAALFTTAIDTNSTESLASTQPGANTGSKPAWMSLIRTIDSAGRYGDALIFATLR